MGTSGIALGFDGGGGRADDVDMVVFRFRYLICGRMRSSINHGNVTIMTGVTDLMRDGGVRCMIAIFCNAMLLA